MQGGLGTVLFTAMLAAAAVAQQPAPLRPITGNDLLAGLNTEGSWLTYSGDYSGRRHSPLTQITPDTVATANAYSRPAASLCAVCHLPSRT
jgi:glucose dehydrogenase